MFARTNHWILSRIILTQPTIRRNIMFPLHHLFGFGVRMLLRTCGWRRSDPQCTFRLSIGRFSLDSPGVLFSRQSINLVHVRSGLHRELRTFVGICINKYWQMNVAKFYECLTVHRRMVCGEKTPTRCYTMVYWTYNPLNMFRGTIMPIIRSSRLYRWLQHVARDTLFVAGRWSGMEL